MNFLHDDALVMKAVQKWVRRQANIPSRCHTIVRPLTIGRQRTVTIMLRGRRKIYTVLRLAVLSDESIEIRDDRREYISRMRRQQRTQLHRRHLPRT